MAKKKAAKKECECLEQVKGQLAEHGVSIKRHLQMNFTTGEGRMSPPSIVVEKKDGKRGKTPTVFCSYCPFCGVKYE
jgi:hypothetical protein